jgi:hypothetical protein
MKKMNNYQAPKAEVIELNVNKDLMGPGGGWDDPIGSTSGDLIGG